MSRVRKMNRFEIDALYGRLQTFVENQRTPGNPRMKLADDVECEEGVDFLICPLHEWSKYYHAEFVDRLRQDFGREADVYDEPEVGGTIRRVIQVPIMIEEKSSRPHPHGHHRRYDNEILEKPSREKFLLLTLLDVVLCMFLWHRITTGTHGF